MADDVVFNITGDSSEAVTSIGDVLKAAQDLDAIFGTINTSIQLVQDALAKFGTTTVDFGTLATDADAVTKSFVALESAVTDAGAALELMRDPLNIIAGVMATIGGDIDTTAKAMADLDTAAGDSATSLADAATSGEALATAMDGLDKTTADAAIALADVNKSASDAAVSLADEADAASAAATAHDGLATAAATSSGAMAASTASTAGAVGAEEDAAVATEGHTKAGNDNGMMLMMLVPLLLQGASAFISQGSAANDAISKVKGLADQSLLLKQNQGELDGVIKNLQTDSVKYGVSMTEAATGLYTLISTGYSTADSMKLLDASMETAGATGARMSDVSKALGTTMSAYGLKADQARDVTNKMTTAVVQGVQNFQDFSTSIGRTADAGKAAGVSLDEVLAAESALTHTNPSVQRDTEHLASLFVSLSAGADKTAAAAKAMGDKFDETKYKTMDLQDKLQYLQNIAHGNSAAFQKLLGNQTDAQTAMDLLANHSQTYAGILEHVKNDTDSLSKASTEAQSNMSYAWNQIQAAISIVSQQLVAMLGPIVGPLLKEFADMLGKVALNANVLKPIFIGLAVAIGVLVFGALGALIGLMAESVSIFVVLGVAVGGLITAIMLLAPKFKEAESAATPLGREIRALETEFKAAADYISKEWSAAMRVVGPLLKDIGTIIKNNVIPALEAFGGGVGQAIVNIMNGIGNAIKAAIPYLQSLQQWIHDKVIPALKEMQPAINAAAETLGKMSPILLMLIPGIIGVAMNFGKIEAAAGIAVKALGGAGQAFLSLGKFAQGVIPFIRSIGPAFTSMKETVQIAMMIFGDFIKTIGPALRTAVSGASGVLKDLSLIIRSSTNPLALFRDLWGYISALLEPVGDAIAAVTGSVGFLAGIVLVCIAAMVTWFATTKEGQGSLKVIWEEVLKLGGVLMSALKPAWDAIQQSMKDLAPLWGQLLDALKPLYPVFVQLGGIIGGLVVIALGILIGVIAGVLTGLGQFLAGVIKVVAGVIQVFTGLIQFFAGFFTIIDGLFHLNIGEIQKGWATMGQGLVNITQGFWKAIQGVCQAFIGTIVGFISGFTKTVIGFFTNLASVVVHNSIWPDMWTAIHTNTQQSTTKIQTTNQQFTAKMQQQFTDFGTKAPAIMQQTWTKMQSDQTKSNATMNTNQTQSFTQMNTTTKTAMTTMGQTVQQGFTQMNTNATTSLNNMNTQVKQKFDQMAKTVTDDFTKMQQASDKFWKTFNDNINGNLAKAVKAVQDGFDKMDKTVASDLQDMTNNNNKAWLNVQNTCVKTMDYIVKINTMTWQNMLATFKDFGMAIGYANDDTWKQVEDGTSSGTDKVKGIVKDLGDSLKQVFDDLDKQAKTWGEDLIKNFIDGMNSQLGALKGAAQTAAQTVKGPLGFSLPSEGPLRDADTYMPDMMQLFAKGIQDNVGLVKNAAYQAAQAVQTAAPSSINIGTSNQSQISKEHIDVLKDILQAIKDQGKQGQQGTSGSTSIGYPIPSTTLGSINQQFGGSGNGNAGPNAIAGIYTQINQLAGLSSEYAKRGATTGVGF
jgi:TP901 family phage tail tape measure protein